MAWATLVVAVIALLKEVVVAKSFGASWELDAFLLSFSIAFFLPVLLSTTLQGTFVPAFAELFKSDPSRAWRFASVTLNILALAMLGSVAILVLTGSSLISFLAPGLGASAKALSVSLLWTLSPTVILTAVNEQLKNTLHALKVFALPSLSQGLPSLFAIGAILLAGRRWGVYAFAVGWNAGLVAQSTILFWSVKREGGSYLPIVGSSVLELRKLMSLSLTYIFVPLSLLALLLVDKYFASLLGAGAISYFSYAEKLFRVPWMIIAAALFTTALPFFSEQVADQNLEELKNSISLTLRLAAFLTIPIAMGMSVLSQPLISILFERGAFTAADTTATAYVLIGFMASLFFYSMIFIFDRGLCALGQTRVLMKLALVALLVKFLCAWLMTDRWGLLGLALSTVPALAFQSFAMYAAIQVRIGTLELQSLLISLGKILVASAIMAAAVFATWNNPIFSTFDISFNHYNVVILAVSIVFGGLVYWLVSLGMRSNEARVLLQILEK